MNGSMRSRGVTLSTLLRIRMIGRPCCFSASSTRWSSSFQLNDSTTNKFTSASCNEAMAARFM
jgi:hypothetical protein